MILARPELPAHRPKLTSRGGGKLAIVAGSTVFYAIVGAAFAGYLPSGAGHVLHLAGKPWNWLGEGAFPLGGFAAGLFAHRPGQLLAQLVGTTALVGVVLPLDYLLFALLKRIVPFRVNPEGERRHGPARAWRRRLSRVRHPPLRVLPLKDGCSESRPPPWRST